MRQKNVEIIQEILEEERKNNEIKNSNSQKKINNFLAGAFGALVGYKYL